MVWLWEDQSFREDVILYFGSGTGLAREQGIYFEFLAVSISYLGLSGETRWVEDESAPQTSEIKATESYVLRS